MLTELESAFNHFTLETSKPLSSSGTGLSTLALKDPKPTQGDALPLTLGLGRQRRGPMLLTAGVRRGFARLRCCMMQV